MPWNWRNKQKSSVIDWLSGRIIFGHFQGCFLRLEVGRPGIPQHRVTLPMRLFFQIKFYIL